MLIALAWPSHIHHRSAHAWFERRSAAGWATCPMTQSAFVRISSNPKIIPETVTPQNAVDLLKEMTSLDHHVFWTDDVPFDRSHLSCDLLVGHRQVTDAYLLGLAIRRKGRLVTLDEGVASLLPPQSPLLKAVEIVPARKT